MKEEKQPQAVQPQFSPTGEKLTADQIKIGYWFVTNKLLIRRISILALVTFNILLFVYIFYGLLSYFVINRNAANEINLQVTSERLNYSYMNEISHPLPLSIVNVHVLKNGDNKYDFMAEINNENSTWYSPSLTYHFEYEDQKTDTLSTHVLPLQQKFVMKLGLESADRISDAILVIDDIQWQKQANFEQIRDEVFHYNIIEPTYLSSTKSGLSDVLKVSSVEFLVKNESAYNFWNTDFQVLLYRGNKLVYINEIPVRTINSEETKDIKFNIFEKIDRPDKVYVFPDVDYLNPDSFKGFEG